MRRPSRVISSAPWRVMRATSPSSRITTSRVYGQEGGDVGGQEGLAPAEPDHHAPAPQLGRDQLVRARGGDHRHRVRPPQLAERGAAGVAKIEPARRWSSRRCAITSVSVSERNR